MSLLNTVSPSLPNIVSGGNSASSPALDLTQQTNAGTAGVASQIGSIEALLSRIQGTNNLGGCSGASVGGVNGTSGTSALSAFGFTNGTAGLDASPFSTSPFGTTDALSMLQSSSSIPASCNAQLLQNSSNPNGTFDTAANATGTAMGGVHRGHHGHHKKATEEAEQELDELSELGDTSLNGVMPMEGMSGADYTGMTSDQWSQLSPHQQAQAVENTFQSKLGTALGVSGTPDASGNPTPASFQDIQMALDAKLEVATAAKGIDTSTWGNRGRFGKQELIQAAITSQSAPVAPTSTAATVNS